MIATLHEPTNAQNSAKKKQQRGLIPFKSKKELGGKLDPRINAGGRPKLIGMAYKELLAQVNPATGKTHAEEIAEAQAKAAKLHLMPHSVSAAKELRQATEGDDPKLQVNFNFDAEVLAGLSGLAKRAKVIESNTV